METGSRGRVLFIAPQPVFQWRGSPIRVGFDVQALAELGFEVDLLTLPVGEDRVIPGVQVRRVPNLLGVKRLPIGPSPAKAFFDGVLLAQGARLVRRRAYRVVHGVEEAGALAVLLARLGRCRAVFEKHSDPASHRQGLLRNLVLAAYAAVERFTVRRADAVIATGPGLAGQARAMGGRGPVHDIFDIPSSQVEADPARVAVIRRQWRRTPDEIVVLYVGSFAVYQGVDLMFDAMHLVLEACPGVRFVVIGGSPAEVEARRCRLAGQGGADRVTFAGHFPPDELPHYLAAADILLSPRLSGVNTPLKLLDYLKAGAAIAATDTTANRLILDENTAVLTEVSPAGFAAGITRLIADTELRASLACAGRRRIDEVYNYANFKAKLGACYEEVLKGPGAALP